MSKVTISIDPGEHIGIVYHKDNMIIGTTITGHDRNNQLWQLLLKLKPEEVLYEQFALRPGAASKMIGNKFITCEVIGVVKLYCQLNNMKPVTLQPSMKEYCGFSSSPKDEHYKVIQLNKERITEHVRDAFRLYSYWKLFGPRFK